MSFAERWSEGGEALVVFPLKALRQTGLDGKSAVFLQETGLPDSAAPFLSFGLSRDGSLPTAAQQWCLSEEFSHYRVVGSNGAGDPVCVDEANGRVVYLNHDCGFEAVFINSSLASLAECLLEYRRLVDDTVVLGGPQAYLDGNVPENAIAYLESAIGEIDRLALGTDTFWESEIERLRADAQEFRSRSYES